MLANRVLGISKRPRLCLVVLLEHHLLLWSWAGLSVVHVHDVALLEQNGRSATTFLRNFNWELPSHLRRRVLAAVNDLSSGHTLHLTPFRALAVYSALVLVLEHRVGCSKLKRLLHSISQLASHLDILIDFLLV